MPAQADQIGRKWGRGPSEPSKDVIFLGLDAELSESDVSAGNSAPNAMLKPGVVHGLLTC